MIQRSRVLGVLGVCGLAAVPTTAKALEVNFGGSVGAIQVATEPRLAVSPFVGLLWHTEGGLLLAVHNMFSILPGDHIGLHDRTSAALGYTWPTGDVSLGPSLSFYWMLACDPLACRRVDKGKPCTREIDPGLTLCAIYRDDCQAKRSYKFSECYSCGFE